MRKVRELLALSWRQRWLLSQAWWALLVADVALRLLPSARVLAWVGRRIARVRARVPGSATRRASALLDCDRLVRVAARHHLYPMGCLPRSLALGMLLARRGIPCRLRLGARRVGAGLEAHAWIEHSGEPVGEPGGVSEIYPPLTPGVGRG